MIRKLLFATDFSSRSDIALSRASELAARFGAGLTLLHVVDDDQSPADVAALVNLAEEHLAAAVQGLPEALRAVAQQVSTDVSKLSSRIAGDMPASLLGKEPDAIAVVDADPCAAIAAQVRTASADLVIIGARGRNALERILLGSAADAVLRNIDCDILVVPPAG